VPAHFGQRLGFSGDQSSFKTFVFFAAPGG
jgi:hypothetical protein